MINFTHSGVKIKCKPERAAQYRAAIDKPPKIKIKVDRKHDAMRRDYPEFYAGMSALEYINQYANLNTRLQLSSVSFDCLEHAAPMLDATIPEVLEELDPDWAPPAWAPKTRKLTAKQAIVQALDALKLGDIDTAQCILSEALK